MGLGSYHIVSSNNIVLCMKIESTVVGWWSESSEHMEVFGDREMTVIRRL